MNYRYTACINAHEISKRSLCTRTIDKPEIKLWATISSLRRCS